MGDSPCVCVFYCVYSCCVSICVCVSCVSVFVPALLACSLFLFAPVLLCMLTTTMMTHCCAVSVNVRWLQATQYRSATLCVASAIQCLFLRFRVSLYIPLWRNDAPSCLFAFDFNP